MPNTKIRLTLWKKIEALSCNFRNKSLPMSYPEFRKLDIDLPRQPTVDERPWLVAGLLLAFIVLLMSAYAYFGSTKEEASSLQLKEKVTVE